MQTKISLWSCLPTPWLIFACPMATSNIPTGSLVAKAAYKSTQMITPFRPRHPESEPVNMLQGMVGCVIQKRIRLLCPLLLSWQSQSLWCFKLEATCAGVGGSGGVQRCRCPGGGDIARRAEFRGCAAGGAGHAGHDQPEARDGRK